MLWATVDKSSRHIEHVSFFLLCTFIHVSDAKMSCACFSIRVAPLAHSLVLVTYTPHIALRRPHTVTRTILCTKPTTAYSSTFPLGKMTSAMRRRNGGSRTERLQRGIANGTLTPDLHMSEYLFDVSIIANGGHVARRKHTSACHSCASPLPLFCLPAYRKKKLLAFARVQYAPTTSLRR